MPTILIVEDEKTLNKALVAKLKKAGYTTKSAYTGKQGLEALSSQSIDLVLLDVVMPEMDGIEMIYEWHQKNGVDIPIIILTNQDSVAYQKAVSKVFPKSKTDLDQVVNAVTSLLN